MVLLVVSMLVGYGHPDHFTILVTVYAYLTRADRALLLVPRTSTRAHKSLSTYFTQELTPLSKNPNVRVAVWTTGDPFRPAGSSQHLYSFTRAGHICHPDHVSRWYEALSCRWLKERTEHSSAYAMLHHDISREGVYSQTVCSVNDSTSQRFDP